jgi:hypothetical protein
MFIKIVYGYRNEKYYCQLIFKVVISYTDGRVRGNRSYCDHYKFGNNSDKI